MSTAGKLLKSKFIKKSYCLCENGIYNQFYVNITFLPCKFVIDKIKMNERDRN